jgi:hypothetical protein
MPRFYNSKEDNFEPQYGEIDWRSVLVAKLALTGEGLTADPVWFDSGDGLDVQCTQENTDIFVSKASDDMDVVLVYDPRDDQRFPFFRSTLGEDFNAISQALQEVGGAAVHFTLYPPKEIAEIWVRQNTESDLSGFVPEDWMEI